MPIYEYRCRSCGKKTNVFVRTVRSPVHAACEHCGGRRLSRLMSKFAVHRGASSASDDLDDLAGVDEDDPRSVARWARRMAEESGEELGPDFDDMVGRMEAGESPDELFGDDEDGLDDDEF
jgi:putative FmdB family regulatory protein